MVVVTVVTDCRQCLERLVSKVVDLGWMDKHLKQVTCPAAATATTSKCVTERTGICEHDKPGCKWSRVSGAGMSTRKHARNARTGTSMVWCAMDSPTTNVYATEFASVCTKFWLCRVCLVDQGLEVFQT